MTLPEKNIPGAENHFVYRPTTRTSIQCWAKDADEDKS
jgi:hypothetical protein